MRMHAPNKASIKILGAAIIRLWGTAKSGKRVKTRQILYGTDNADKLFISCEACISLGMISEDFPSISEAALLITSSKEAICDCPHHTLPPPRPTNPPCPPTEENIPRIKQYLMDYYHSSTFNTCEHQPLPLMEGPPMKLMIEENAMPVTHHTPFPVSIHWQEWVKADIERDIAQGALENLSHGAITRLYAPKNMASHEEQWTSSHWTNMPQGKPITPSPHSSNQDLCPTTWGKPCLMPGMATIACPSVTKIDI